MSALALSWLMVAVDVSLKAVLLAAAAALLLRVLRIHDSSVRHRVWSVVLVGMLVLPALTRIIPGVSLPVSIGPAESEPNGMPSVETPLPAEVPAATTTFRQDGTTQDPDWLREPFGVPTAVLPNELSPERSVVAETPRFEPAQVPDQQPAPNVATATEWNWRTLAGGGLMVLLAIWALGVCAFVFRLIVGTWISARLRTQPISEGELNSIARAVNWRRPVPVRECATLRVPVMLGWFRPRILLPANWREWSVEKLRAVVRHELTHVERGDAWILLLAELNRALYWPHPLAWWLRRHLSALAEAACDDAAIRETGDRIAYARYLLEVAAVQSGHSGRLIEPGLSMARHADVETRIVAILDFARPLTQRLTWRMTLLIALVAIPAIGLAAALRPAAEEAATDGTSPEQTERMAQANAPNPSLAKKTAQPPDVQEIADSARLEYAGRVVDPIGKPVRGAKLYLCYWSRRPTPPEQSPLAVTAADGRFSFSLPKADFDSSGEPNAWSHATLVATADGYGFASGPSFYFEMTGQLTKDMTEEGLAHMEKLHGPKRDVLTLVEDPIPIQGRVLDTEGRPVANARLSVRVVWDSRDGSLDAWEKAAREPRADFYTARETLNYVINGPRSAAVFPEAVSDADGRVVLRGLGRGRLAEVIVSGPGIESSKVYVRTRAGETIRLDREASHQELGQETYYPAEFTHVAGPSQPVVGTVTDSQTGKPLAGLVVQAHRLSNNPIGGELSAGFIATVTDEEGRYRLEGFPVGGENEFNIVPPIGSRYLPGGASVKTTASPEPLTHDVQLTAGVLVRGRVMDRRTGEPVPGRLEYFAFLDNPALEQAGSFRRSNLDHHYLADDEGRFAIPVLPGRGILAFMANNHQQYPRGAGVETIDGPKEGFGFFRTVPSYCVAGNWHLLTPLNPQPDDREITLDLTLASGLTFTGRVLAPNGETLRDYLIYGKNVPLSWSAHQGETFKVQGYFPEEGRRLMFAHPERDLVGLHEVSGEPPQELTVTLKPGGRVKGRVVDADGQPLEGLMLINDSRATASPAEDRQQIPADRGLIPNHFEARRELVTDADGRFEIPGMIPGLKYSVGVLGPGQIGNERVTMYLGTIFQEVIVEPGMTKDLGDLVPKPRGEESSVKEPQAASPRRKVTLITGRITTNDGRPVRGEHVAVIGMNIQPKLGGDLSSQWDVLAEGTTGENGQYELRLVNASPRTHRYARVIARKDGAAIAWRELNLDAMQVDVPLTVAPEAPIRGRLIDLEGQPADGVRLSIVSVIKRNADGPATEGVGYHGERVPAAWVPAVTADAEGHFEIRGVPAGYGVLLETSGNDRFAPQSIALNTGLPEQRGERDGTYRPLVRNVEPSDEAVLPLAPAQLFEGVVRYADSGEPVPQARITIWASQQQEFGSMVSVAGQADEQGRYRISPRPGVRFGLNVYPPEGVPYLARKTPHSEAIRWQAGDRVKSVDLTLPRGVLVRGTIVEAGTAPPVAGATVQYIPESANNPHVADDILTGWQGIRLADQDGQFSIAVLPGPGHLLVHGPQGKYVLQEIGSRQLNSGKSGGQRTYAHGIKRINPEVGAESLEVRLELQPGATVTGRILDAQGQPVDEALVISRLNISPTSPHWRGHSAPALGGRFELSGLAEGVEYPVYFLDARRQLGASVTLTADSREQTVVLAPCGRARLRVVNARGEPVAGHILHLEMTVTPGTYRFDSAALRDGDLAADADFVANIDQMNYSSQPKSNQNGEILLPALIPGAHYQIVVQRDGRLQVVKDFQAQTNETVELGDLVIEDQE